MWRAEEKKKRATEGGRKRTVGTWSVTATPGLRASTEVVEAVADSVYDVK